MNFTKVLSIPAVGVLAAAIALSGCSKSDDAKSTSTTMASPGVTVANPWARQSPTGAQNGAIYMSLTSTNDDELRSASVPSSVAAKTEIHETTTSSPSDTAMGSSTTMMSGGTNDSLMGSDTATTMMGSGQMQMKPVASIALPAGQTVELEPGGYHIMLLELAAPLTIGETITVTLTFEKAGEQQVTATVREG